MNYPQQDMRQKICDDVTQLQVDLEIALHQVFEQAGSRIEPEKQEAVQKDIDGTKQLLEHFKRRYT